MIKLCGGSFVNNRRNTEDLIASISVIILGEKKKEKKNSFYLFRINIITIYVDIGIIGEKFSTGDIGFGSNLRTRFSKLYNIDFFTVLTDKT